MNDFLVSFTEAFGRIMEGVPNTLMITFLGLAVSFSFAFCLTLVKNVGGKICAKLVDIYILFFAGTPLLFQFFLFYYGPTQFEFISQTWLMDIFNNTFFIAILVIGLNSGAYSTIIFTGALKNIDKSQWQVCESMGLTKLQTFRLLFPYALRRVLPTYSNEVILLFKGTSLVSMITVTDIFGLAKQYYGETYDAIVAYSTAGVLYLIISLILTLILRIIEKNWMKYAI